MLQPLARRVRRRDLAAIARLDRLRSDQPLARLSAALAFLGLKPWTDSQLCALSGLPIECIPSALDRLIANGALVEIPIGPKRSVRILAEFAADLDDRVIRALGRLHAARPRQAAIPRAHLAAELPDLGSDALISGIVSRLEAQGKVIVEARTVALKGHEPRLSQGERRLKAELLEAIRSAGLSPPDASDLAGTAGPRAAIVPELLALLRDEQKLVELSPGLFLDFDIEAELRRKVAQRLADGSAMTMADLRDLLGTTRKYAVPIGEYLDRIGLTRREGDVRKLGGSSRLAEAWLLARPVAASRRC